MDRIVNLSVKKLDHFDNNLPLPQYESTGAAGADLRASFPEKDGINIAPGERVLIPTGLSFEIPHGYEVQIRPRSGISFKTSLLVVNSPGTIDCDYRGEVKIILGNFGKEDFFIEHGTRVAQMVISPVWQASLSLVDDLSDTDRGLGGFGSTGLK